MSSDIGAWHDGGGGSWTSPLFSMPFSSDPWDPWDYYGGGSEDAAALAHASIDCIIFRLDLPAVRKEDVKVQVEEGREVWRRINGTGWSAAAGAFPGDSGCRKMLTWRE